MTPVALVACAVATALAGLRWLRVAQREHYLVGSCTRFAIRWWFGLGFNTLLAVGAPSGVQVVAREADYASVKMPSGEIRKINVECYATIGQVGNIDHENISIGKAGRSRWMGNRPHNRGVVMNPVDHPHGGGEGKTSGGRHPVSPWGMPTKGYKTRNRKNTDRFIVTRRQK